MPETVVATPMTSIKSIRVPDAPAVKTVPTVVGAVNEVSAVVSSAAPKTGVVAYCAVVDINKFLVPLINKME